MVLLFVNVFPVLRVFLIRKSFFYAAAMGGDVGEIIDDALLRIKTLIEEKDSSKKELALTTFLYLYTAIHAGIG